MRRERINQLVGGVILLSGILLLLQNMGLLNGADERVWSILFGIGGLVAISVTAQDPERWWALIPGAALLSLCAVTGLSSLAPQLTVWGGTIFLAGLSFGFLGVYLLQRRFWWAIIPGGTLLTLAAVTASPGNHSASVLFLGLAATFACVSVVPSEGGPRRWGLLPAAVLAVMALSFFINRPMVLQVGWPLVLIGIGLAFLYRSRHREDKMPDQTEKAI